ncbi:MAG: UvrB/UvrC motif-containing protein [Candidatus Omnitrophica bacterium]|nr:UvrB/UvrC motif-containing protein [Candidatus Omnitrophota bacterium]
MKDCSQRVIYIGKAKSLKKRLITYLSKDISVKTQALILKVCDIEFKLCPNESMALLLESALVHKYRPKYNVALRDDKSFPMVKITKDNFPAVYITRKRHNDGARYFGPYTSAGLLRQAMKTIRKNFPYLIYKQAPQEKRIDQSLGLSPGKEVGSKEYSKRIENISLLLQGNTDGLIRKLCKEMHERSDNTDFEGAAKIRDQISSLSVINEGIPFSCQRQGLGELKNLLKMQKIPKRIEAFDISDISGKEACGSMVSFYDGRPDKDNYRRFRIKTVTGINDYHMLREVIRRRYSRVLRGRLKLPNLIVIDGGRGHLSVVEKELKSLGIELPLLSIAKKEENIYIKGKKSPVKLDRYSSGLNLIRRIRDEAHRFALSYHHILRRKKIICR